eukprot:COSAG01_NODE_7240_length_3288_cov_21.522107_7_plen_27_part_01
MKPRGGQGGWMIFSPQISSDNPLFCQP